MASFQESQGASTPLPSASPNQIYVKVAALNGGFVTLPEKAFVMNADPDKAATTPSMCFLIEHPTADAGKVQRIVFDLGIKRDLRKYGPATQEHVKHRQPVYSTPDAKFSLLAGGMDPAKDIDLVILSHVHWDHIGEPSDYPNSKFIVGSGTLHILEHGPPFYPHERLEKGSLPVDRTVELPPLPTSERKHMAAAGHSTHVWQSLSVLPNVVDYFGDGSVFIVDTPGHLHGHINALLRVGPEKWVYLGGDCCHDRRIITGDREIAQYDDGHGKIKSAHEELPVAKNSIQNIRNLIVANEGAVEWVIAHDTKWACENQHRFLPNWMY